MKEIEPFKKNARGQVVLETILVYSLRKYIYWWFKQKKRVKSENHKHPPPTYAFSGLWVKLGHNERLNQTFNPFFMQQLRSMNRVCVL